MDRFSDNETSKSIVSAELELLSQLPDTILTGISERVDHLCNEPATAALEIGGSVAFGVGLAALSRCAPGAVKMVPKIAGIVASLPIASAFVDTAINPEHSISNSKSLGKTLGTLIVDGGLIGGGTVIGMSLKRGLASNRAYLRMPENTGRVNSTVADEVSTPAGTTSVSADAVSPMANQLPLLRDQMMPVLKSWSNDHATSAKERARGLEQAVNAFCDAVKLPHVSLSAQSSFHRMFVRGSYQDNGKIRIHRSLIESNDRKDHAETFKIIAHELTHHEQHAIKIRSVADGLGIGETASKSQFKHLSEHLPDSSKQLIKDVVDLRHGEKLSPTGQMRADKLFDSGREWGKFWNSREWGRLQKQQKDLESFNEKLTEHEDFLSIYDGINRVHLVNDPKAPETLSFAWRVANRIVSGGSSKLTALIFGAERPPTALLKLTKPESGRLPVWYDSDSGERSFRIIRRSVIDRLDKIETKLDGYDTRYRNLFHEREAFHVDDLADALAAKAV